jgi:hypothetical protein
MTWAVEQKVPALQKLVLLMLANRTNSDTGCCIPRIKLLAEDCGMGETATKSAIKALESSGLLVVEERYRDSTQLSNQYRLLMPVRGSQGDGGGSPNDPGSVVTRPRGGRQAPTESGIESGTETNTPLTPQGGQVAGADALKAKRGNPSVCLKTWLANIKEQGQKPVSESDPIFAWAERVGLPAEFLSLAWQEFKRKHASPDSKTRKSDWRRHFRNTVESNWLRLWYLDNDTYTLTTVGKQAQRNLGDAA